MKVKEKSEKTGLKLNIQKTKIMASGPINSVQSLSHVRLFATTWTEEQWAPLFIHQPRSLLKLMSTDSVMPSKHLILCCPLLLPPQSFPVSGSFQMRHLFTSGGTTFTPFPSIHGK